MKGSCNHIKEAKKRNPNAAWGGVRKGVREGFLEPVTTEWGKRRKYILHREHRSKKDLGIKNSS